MTETTRGLLWAIMAMIATGVGTYLYKFCKPLGPVNTTFYYFMFASVFAFMLWVGYRETHPIDKKLLVYPAVIAVCFLVAIVALNIAIQPLGGVAIPGTIRGLSFIVTVILAAVISRERLTLLDMLAVGLAAISIAIIWVQKRP